MTRYVAIALLLGVTAVIGDGMAEANTHSSRQYYGGWQRSPSKGYYYRSYYYKPNKDYYGYKHHYMVYYPSSPRYYYYYNPYQKKYWGRCPTATDGKPIYHMLNDDDRRAEVKDIPEKAFRPQDKMPALPDSTDGTVMDLPPDELPPVGDLGKFPAVKQ